MDKETLIQNLKTKVGEDNVKVISDKTFDGIAESVLSLFAEDEKITEDTWKLPVATLIQFAGQKRFDEKTFTEKYKSDYATQHEKDVEARIKAATEKALEEYKKAHPEQKPAAQQGETPKTEDIVKAVLESLNSEEGAIGKLSKQFTDYVTSQSEREKAAVKARVKASLKAHLTDMKANNMACVDDALDDIEYGDNPTFEDLKQKAIDAYETRYKRYYADGGKPFGGQSSGGAGGGENTYVKEKLAQLEKEAKESADYAKTMENSFQ